MRGRCLCADAVGFWIGFVAAPGSTKVVEGAVVGCCGLLSPLSCLLGGGLFDWLPGVELLRLVVCQACCLGLHGSLWVASGFLKSTMAGSA